MDNCLILQMPEYTPQYKDDEVYGYNNEREKKSLKKVLTEASREYCMYCYNRFVISGSYYGHLEHAEYYGAAEPPVRCGKSHLSGLTEPFHFLR